jgi:hypothetical protein
MDDRSLTNPNANVPDAGTPAPTTATPTPSVPVQSATTPNQIPPATDNSNSNQPDASTPAAKSIPANLVNNPAVPTQKMAAQADANKNSPAPAHSMLYNKAIEMTGGQRYTTTIDADGNTVRTPIQPKPWALGLALALDVLSGGLAGASATGPGRFGKAAEAGAAVADKQRAAVQQANQQQDEQAQNDQKYKLAVTEANMRNHQTALLVGKEDQAISQTYADSFKPLAEPLMNGNQVLPEGVSVTQPQFETDATAAIKNGKTNVTHDFLMPVGDAIPMRGANGDTVMQNGHAVYGHNYITVHGADKFQASLNADLVKKLQSVGYFMQDGKPANINPNSPWPFADLAKKSADYASIMAGEQIMQRHKDDAHDLLGKDTEDLSGLADAVRKDPTMRDAVRLFSQAANTVGNSHIDEILNAMSRVDANKAGMIADYLGLKGDDLNQIANKRLQEEAEAKAKPTPAEKIDSPDKANAVLADPSESATRKTQAKAFLKGSTATAAGKAAAEATAKTNAETNSGDVQQAARNVVSGDLTNLKDITSMRGGQRTAMFNAIHDEAVSQGKNPNDWGPAALKTKADMWEDYREGKTSNNITAFDAFLGHANDAMDANDAWRRSGSPLINKPLTWLAKNADNDTNYTAFTTALEPVRKEFMSFLNANRAEHEGDIKTMGTVLSDSSTPAQIETALKQLGKSADIRLAAIGRKYQNTMGTSFPNLISDDGKQTLQRMGITSKTSAASNAPKVAPEGTIVSTPKGQMVKQGGQWVPYQGGK